MGGKNQTSTTQSNQTYTPTGAAQLQDIWNKVQGVASQPYTPYGGQLTAGLSGTQQTAIGNLTGPNYQTAVNYAQNGAQSIDPADISRYQNPYTQSVINATQNQFNNQNAQQQQQVVGNAAMQGALGGDRVGVARAQLANQQQLAQAPVIANLNAQNYSQALQAAQADRAAQATGAQNLSNVSNQGALAQLGAGGIEQQTNQSGLSAQYQQYLQALAFPYQQAQFLASSGLPTVTAMGGTQAGQGTTTTPGPSPWGQIAGGGLAAAAMFLKRGGRVNGYASGGSPMGAENFIMVPSYIPQSAAPQSNAPQMTPMQMPKVTASQDTGLPSPKAITEGIGGFQRLFGGEQLTPQTGATYGAPTIAGQDMTFGSMGGVPVPTFFAKGGAVGSHDDFVNTVHSIRRALKNGGTVSSSPFGVQGYDIGGTVDPLSFADRAFPAQEAIANGSFDPQGDNYSPFTQSPTLVPTQTASIPLPQARPGMTADGATSPMAATRSALPPQITNPDNSVTAPEDNQALGYSGAPVTDGMPPRPDNSTMELSAQSKQPQSGGPLGKLLGMSISPEAKAGLLSAGLGMLASRSPFALQAIGEGGLQGVKAYTDAKEKSADRELKKQHVDTEAKRLAQSAEQFSKNLDLHERQFGETKRQHDVTMMSPVKIGVDVTGRDIFGVRDPKSGTYKIIDATTGQIKDPNTADTSAAVLSNAAPIEVRAQAEPGSTKARNDEFLKTLEKNNPGYAAQVKAAADYMIDPNKVFSMRNNIREQFLRNVYQYDPTYDATTFPARNKAVSEFATGKLGNQIRSFDVAISHATTLENLVKELDNTSAPAFNKVANFFKTQFGMDAPNNFDAAKAIVADEIAKGIIGGQTALADREDLQRKLDKASSPEQLAGVIRTFKQLMGGQLHGLKKQYEDTTRLKNFDERLTPLTRDEIAKAENYKRPSAASGPSSTAPSSGFTGRTATGHNGTKLRETSDGKWVP